MIDSCFVCSVFLQHFPQKGFFGEDLGMFDLSAIPKYISTSSAFKFECALHNVRR